MYALVQRASIQATINEQIHNDFVSSLQEGSDIKQARTAHFRREKTIREQGGLIMGRKISLGTDRTDDGKEEGGTKILSLGINMGQKGSK